MTNERGRPRAFDAEQALDSALRVFWKQGYQGAALSELTDAMGLSKPSLYAAFGDKEALYLKALERYATHYLAGPMQLLDTTTSGREAVAAYLRAMARLFADRSQPGGCFIANGIADTEGPTTPPAVQEALHGALRAAEQRMRQRIEQALQAGELHPDASPAELASLYLTVLTGLAVLAKSGESPQKLMRVVDAAMVAWPASPAAGSRKR